MKERHRRHLFSTSFGLSSLLVLFRLTNSLLINTHFEPDEYFQTIEIAMGLLLKKQSVTWEWLFGIRSFVFVSVFYLPLWLSKSILSELVFMQVAPYIVKAVCALLAALGDYSTIKIYQLLIGTEEIPLEIVLVCTMNLGQWLYSTRSHANSLEMNVGMWISARLLSIVSERDKRTKLISLGVSAFISGLLIYIRTSSIFMIGVVWLYVLKKEVEQFWSAWLVVKRKGDIKQGVLLTYLGHSRVLALSTWLGVGLALGLGILIDSWFYGELVVSPFEFIRVNLVYGVSKLFGVLPGYVVLWFVVVLLGGYTGLLVFCRVSYLNLEVVVPAVYLVVHSLIGHKEMRFLLPVLPFFNLIIAKNMRRVWSEVGVGRGLIGRSSKFLFCKQFLAINLLIGILIGIDHQNISRPLSFLRKECYRHISSRSEPVFIFSAFNPYMLPFNTYLGHRRIIVKSLDDNPDLSGVLDRLKRVQRYKHYNLVLQEHTIFSSAMISNLKRAGILEYDYLVINSQYDTEIEQELPELIKVHESLHMRIPYHQSVSIYKRPLRNK
ncbi:GPI mannosyltransferase 3 [Nematocida homosporus]|uniref:GPI mannosyltransferase 3 n=1 Tax=Nematocida homosporus TaxID=1912981 RepID=UPI00221FF909|nr:GPI mannosyltransferase 3 [Nematocida homosporus]KAI5186529.1 GPI mannosyltransferase 3 [Nematocida homosporus]